MNKRFHAVLLVACLASAIPAHSQPSPRDTANLLDRRFAAMFAPHEPGCVIGIAQGGTLIATRGYGLANLDYGLPMKPDTVFDIGSASKQFTAAAVAILARRGKVDLDADIRTYLPAMQQFDPPVTVRQLIHHSSGLPDPYDPLETLFHSRDGNYYPSELTLRMAEGTKSTKFKPGSRYEYSNVGYLLLAQIVERVSGKRFRDFANENIFQPLGMTRTHVHDDIGMIVPNRATAYSLSQSGDRWEMRHSDFVLPGDGSVYSTVGDLAKWYGSFASPRLEGGAELVRMLLTPGEYSEQGPSYIGHPIRYAYGIQVFEWNGEPVFGHPGGWAGFGSVPYHFPRRNITIVSLCNTRKPDVLRTVLDLGAQLSKSR